MDALQGQDLLCIFNNNILYFLPVACLLCLDHVPDKGFDLYKYRLEPDKPLVGSLKTFWLRENIFLPLGVSEKVVIKVTSKHPLVVVIGGINN